MTILPPTSANARYEQSFGCRECFAQHDCGGQYRTGQFGCFCTTCNPTTCSYCCPRNKNFVKIWRDSSGTGITTTHLHQEQNVLPTYIPLIQHGNRRTTPLQACCAGITTFDATRRDKRTKDMVRDPRALRRKFQVEATIILSSVAPDNELERYWKYRHEWRLIEGIKAINPAHVIAPNFSLFLDIPRFDNLANIKRSMLCAEELSKAGISIIPYIAGITATDWERWAAFLREHRTITMVCKEFQTGASSKDIGAWHINRLQELQERVARALHLVAVGGRRHLRYLRSFPHLTIMDSVPFMRTMHRRQLTTTGWEPAPTAAHIPLNDLLQANVEAYAALLHERRPSKTIVARRAVLPEDQAQLALPFPLPIASPRESCFRAQQQAS